MKLRDINPPYAGCSYNFRLDWEGPTAIGLYLGPLAGLSSRGPSPFGQAATPRVRDASSRRSVKSMKPRRGCCVHVEDCYNACAEHGDLKGRRSRQDVFTRHVKKVNFDGRALFRPHELWTSAPLRTLFGVDARDASTKLVNPGRGPNLLGHANLSAANRIVQSIRRRRPTPATLFRVADQSSPEDDQSTHQWVVGENGVLKPKRVNPNVYQPPSLKAVQKMAEAQMLKLGVYPPLEDPYEGEEYEDHWQGEEGEDARPAKAADHQETATTEQSVKFSSVQGQMGLTREHMRGQERGGGYQGVRSRARMSRAQCSF
ncbi:putative protein phosphatase 1 regulatory subunit 1B-like [Scophthalmus maximus]|uniref:Protein phosphatase 1 regulatory subunit 1B n=1 Tax=Scophthalmus maximus TaxID=52904 RepID=A0A2U9CRM7_SCOMX|nr:putative protein phosphatase 1 regulatory subunit 1B-like [Scophthalmus maximus]